MAEKQSVLGRVAALAQADVDTLVDSAADPEALFLALGRAFSSTLSEAEEELAHARASLRLAEHDRDEDEESVDDWGAQAATAAYRAAELRIEGNPAGADAFDELARIALTRQVATERELEQTRERIRVLGTFVTELSRALASAKEQLAVLEDRRARQLGTVEPGDGRVLDTETPNVLDPTTELTTFELKLHREEERHSGTASVPSYLDAWFTHPADPALRAQVDERLELLRPDEDQLVEALTTRTAEAASRMAEEAERVAAQAQREADAFSEDALARAMGLRDDADDASPGEDPEGDDASLGGDVAEHEAPRSTESGEPFDDRPADAGAEVSEAETQDAETQDAETQDAETPGASTPEAAAPEAETPEAAAPEAETPEAAAPEAETPEAAAPEAETPEAAEEAAAPADRPEPDAVEAAVREAAGADPVDAAPVGAPADEAPDDAAEPVAEDAPVAEAESTADDAPVAEAEPTADDAPEAAFDERRGGRSVERATAEEEATHTLDEPRQVEAEHADQPDQRTDVVGGEGPSDSARRASSAEREPTVVIDFANPAAPPSAGTSSPPEPPSAPVPPSPPAPPATSTDDRPADPRPNGTGPADPAQEWFATAVPELRRRVARGRSEVFGSEPEPPQDPSAAATGPSDPEPLGERASDDERPTPSGAPGRRLRDVPTDTEAALGGPAQEQPSPAPTGGRRRGTPREEPADPHDASARAPRGRASNDDPDTSAGGPTGSADQRAAAGQFTGVASSPRRARVGDAEKSYRIARSQLETQVDLPAFADGDRADAPETGAEPRDGAEPPQKRGEEPGDGSATLDGDRAEGRPDDGDTPRRDRARPQRRFGNGVPSAYEVAYDTPAQPPQPPRHPSFLDHPDGGRDATVYPLRPRRDDSG
ncbi:hypothetical protein CLV56_2812 [Mumia flava]|uniref:Uncharacterized protein n=1 Tax=Mumia flava TaxID=1348852 RepID=A0A2M9BKV3_9ACTN|nr:hypothetical protein [Mumia flava]PJJ58561.1 hypothetical protein CLV56_2812 [Mumia flava]